MIGIRVEVDKITKSIGRQVVSRGYRAVNAIRNAELEVLNGKGGGRTYRKPGGGTYVASAPGQPPARRSGALRQAWSGRVEEGASGGGSTSIVAVLQSDMFYAEYLENGTRKMAPRPFVDRIAQKSLPEITAIYSEPFV